jgi:hypothetical protein
MVALASSQALFNTSLKPHWRVILGGLAAATLAVGWFQVRDWASGWVPGHGGCRALIWLRLAAGGPGNGYWQSYEACLRSWII